jgi:uncharacterized protein involved in exopolysaccharide biosynthesis
VTRPADDLLDVAELLALLRAGWRWLLGGTVAGLVAGLTLVWVLPPQWEGRASVLTTRSDPGLLGAAAGIASSTMLGSSLNAQAETDLALLRSRRLLHEVSAVLPLSVRLRAPRLPVASVVQRFVPQGLFKPLRLDGQAEGDGWRLRGPGVDTLVRAGQPLALPVGTLTLAAGAPARFALTLYDADEGVERSAKRVSVTRAGGTLLSVAVRWDDSVTGAQIANALVARYLAWRRDTDAGENATRLAFVSAQADTARARLDSALQALREYQEATGQLDPGQTGGGLLQLAAELNGRLRGVVLEAEALDALLDALDRGSAAARTLTGFPTFLRSQTLNDLLGELVSLESQRATLLATRTPEDPAVVGRTEAIRVLEGQLLPIARTYRAALAQDQARVGQAVDSVAQVVAQLPGQGQRHFYLLREVQRFNELSLALASQQVQLRLATVGEGGTARAVDEALPRRKPSRPRPLLSVGGGAAAGLLFGLVMVLAVAPRRRPSLVT